MRNGHGQLSIASYGGDVTSLDSAYSKLCRARSHARELRTLLDAFRDENTYRVVRSVEGSAVYYRVVGSPSPHPHVGVVLGDFLVNVRGALDHTAWALVPDDSPVKAERPEVIKFPIREHPLRAKGGAAVPAGIAGVTDQAINDAVERVQPYNAAIAKGQTNALWMLNTLCNIDKHRFQIAGAGVLDMRIWWGLPEDVPSPKVTLWPWRPVAPDQAIAVFDFDGREPPDDFDPSVALEVRLDEPAAGDHANRHELMALVGIIYQQVEHFVIGEYFAPFFGLHTRHAVNLDWGCDCGGRPERRGSPSPR